MQVQEEIQEQEDLQEKEFVPLTRDAIKRLIENRQHLVARMQGRPTRRLPRWPFPGPIQLWVRNVAGEEIEIFGTCHNLNENGAGIYCERPIEEGTRLPVAIHQPEATYQGEAVVRHCTQSGKEYFVGLEFVEN